MKKRLILGGPGTGKTTRLLKIMDDAIRRGFKHDRIAFCSFTKAASQEGRERALKQFGIPDEKGALPYFRTLHSLCFTEMGLRRDQVIQPKDYKVLERLIGRNLANLDLDFDLKYFDDVEYPMQSVEANPLLTIDHYARTTRQTVEEAWRMKGRDVYYRAQEQFSAIYAAYKFDHHIIDFTDMLQQFVDTGHPVPVDIAILDEVQDMTPLQWEVARVAFGNVQELYAGGDDDQSIYDWAGAAKDHMLRLKDEGWEIEHLIHSHRLPTTVYVLSQKVVKRIKHRYEKPTKPTGKEGKVDRVRTLEQFDWSPKTGEWLMLARTHRQLIPLAQEARRRGYNYSLQGNPSVSQKYIAAIIDYELIRRGEPLRGEQIASLLKIMNLPAMKLDAEELYGAADLKVSFARPWDQALVKIAPATRRFYLECRRNGEKLKDAPPRVRISTIHAAKGLEAKNVMLQTDLTYQTWTNYDKDPEPEDRAMYVGITRAMEQLVLLVDQSIYDYAM